MKNKFKVPIEIITWKECEELGMPKKWMCFDCHGQGNIVGKTCENCGGSGIDITTESIERFLREDRNS